MELSNLNAFLPLNEKKGKEDWGKIDVKVIKKNRIRGKGKDREDAKIKKDEKDLGKLVKTGIRRVGNEARR